METQINNAFYDDLKEDWYESASHPIALLRAENKTRNPWILKTIFKKLGSGQQVLDIGCGAGFLSNILGLSGHKVTGIDLSSASLEEAKKRDFTHTVDYLLADATQLPFPEHSFDVVCAMDLLEHVEDPAQVIKEASRVLKPGGLFFFHTFNRTPLSWLTVIKGIEWCMPSAPKNMHVYPLFIKPKELTAYCAKNNLQVELLQGLRPVFLSPAFCKSLIQKKVTEDFRFTFSRSLQTGYVGYAVLK